MIKHTYPIPSVRSTLHADPFSWYGYNYLLEGRKLWTFMPPSVSDSLGAYRLEPNAWGEGDDKFGFAAGWQSPVDLYWDLTDEVEGDEGESSRRAYNALDETEHVHNVPDVHRSCLTL